MQKNKLLNEKKVLDFFVNKVKNKEINFLEDKDTISKELISLLNQLQNSSNMHEKITLAKQIWIILFENSMSFIDPDKRGYDNLFNYFEDYVNFEELIFASDSFYRDHTLHCLWVYFLGVYVHKNEDFKYLFKLELEKNKISKFLDDIQKIENNKIKNKLYNFFYIHYEVLYLNDASYCITALTHDLGYPLKKIDKINKAIRKVLPYYSIKKINEYNFDYSLEQNNYIKEFIKSLSYEVRYDISPKVEKENYDLVDKFYKSDDDGSLIGINYEFLNSLEDNEQEIILKSIDINSYITQTKNNEIILLQEVDNNNHGIMSSYLLFNLLTCFSNNEIHYKLNGNISKKSYKEHPIDRVKKDILKANIAHTTESFQISSIEGLSEFLTFIDEIEEFSRISRANQNRQFINEFCKSTIYTSQREGKRWFHIDFIFDNNEIDSLNPELTFKGKCKRFLKLFDLKNLDESINIDFKCIGKLKTDKNIYNLLLSKNQFQITINDESKDTRKYLKTRET